MEILMKAKRLAIQSAKRNKKRLFKEELKKLRETVFVNNTPVSADALAEYQIAKTALMKAWYPQKLVRYETQFQRIIWR